MKPSTAVAFSDMVIHSFKDKSFREGISPVLADMVSPLIEKTVYAAVTTAVKAATEGLKSSVTEGMNKSNKDLQDTVTKKNKIIENQKSIIDEQELMLDSNLSITEDLQCNVHLLAAEVDEVRFSHNELEKYGRRNSLRINNFVLDTPVENEHELTRRYLYFLNTAVLKSVTHKSTVARTVLCRQDGRGRFLVLLDDHSKCRTNSQRKSQLS